MYCYHEGLRLYLLQSAGLVLVHAHSRWVISHSADDVSADLEFNNSPLKITPDIPLWQFYLTRLAFLTVLYTIVD